MLDLMPQHDGEFILVLHYCENAASHNDLATWISHGAAKTGVRIEMKLVRQLALRVLCDLVANFLQVDFDGLRFRRVGKSLGLLERCEKGVAGTNLVGG